MNLPVPHALALLLAALLHDDVALLMAGYVVLQHDLSPASALAAVYAGTLANNFAIYGLGMAARRLPSLRRWLISDKVEHARQQLKRRLLPTMLLCRFIPGSLSAALLGCGWLGIPFARVAWITAATAALYVSLVGALVFVLGETLLRQLGDKVWWLALVLIAVTLLVFAWRTYAGLRTKEAVATVGMASSKRHSRHRK